MVINRFKKPEGKQLIYDSYERLVGQWGVEVEESDIPTTYGHTHILTAGSRNNPPLMLFHGVGDNSALMWLFNISELSRHFFVIAVDTLGGPGKSEPNANYMKTFEQSLWINEILLWLGLEKVSLAGVSNGSYIASYYTITNPDRVNKVIALAGGVKVNMLRMVMLFMPEALLPASEKNTKKLLRKLCAPTSTVFESNQELMNHWTYLRKYFNNKSMMYHKYKKFTNEDISVLKEKALFLIGQYDRLSNYPAAIKDLEMNQVPYKIIPDAGHGINHEQADHINREMIRFLTVDA
ncbi:alpha/beta fold hydrolase [Paenibacillus sp. FJAT-26967]|uniref:alpha/beta fold hydrolase n=1 Tax=Paenibacillus sp. FJAT-26967 TaxID=1729690 RepID=UPI0008386CB6|nr:alpha/beta hydrolase [Paenibacillus sp. FJAT-26967]